MSENTSSKISFGTIRTISSFVKMALKASFNVTPLKRHHVDGLPVFIAKVLEEAGRYGIQKVDLIDDEQEVVLIMCIRKGKLNILPATISIKSAENGDQMAMIHRDTIADPIILTDEAQYIDIMGLIEALTKIDETTDIITMLKAIYKKPFDEGKVRLLMASNL